MNNTVLKHLQFGFEIEGVFHNKLENLPGKFKEDGSVGSEEHLSIPGSFPFIPGDGDSDGESCERCEGDGRYYEDCQCDYDVHRCEHNCSHTAPCTRSVCAHECDNDCYIRSCDDDDEYHHVDCPDCDGHGSRNGDSQYAQEYASKVIKTMEELLAEVSKFDKQTHIWNKTCGLHLHIGNKPRCKPGYKKLWNATGNLDFLRKLSDEACTWCECQRTRLICNDDLYFQFWKNPYDFISTFNQKYPLRAFSHSDPCSKFRFLRFHDTLHTLEFRFLAPCEHKVQNIKKLLSLLTDYLGSDSTYENQANVDEKPVHETVKLLFTREELEPVSDKLTFQIPVRERAYVLHNDF